MAWMNTKPEDAAHKRGIADANAGRAMKVDPHWGPAMREAYRSAYNRRKQQIRKGKA